MACIQSIYEQDEASVPTQAGLAEAFPCTAGVKQGCPDSPLLFGLYMDELEALLGADANRIDAPKLLDILVATLLSDDDIALMSHSPSRLTTSAKYTCQIFRSWSQRECQQNKKNCCL